MPQLALYGTGIAFSFIAWGIVTAQYVWPELRRRSRADALRPLLLLHCFRFVGLSFLVPGVVAPDLSAAFAIMPAGILLPRSCPAGISGWAAHEVGARARLGVQPVGHRRPPLRVLSGQSGRARAGSAWCHLLHRDRPGAVAVHHPRARVPAAAPGRHG